MITRRIARPLGTLSSSPAWKCPSCTRASLLQQHIQRRRVSDVPALGHDKTFRQDGVPGLFSPTGYQIAWTTYQSMTVQKLNDLIAGEPIETMQPKDLVIQFARDPMNASVFNHASMAHNNHFFFKTLSTSPVPLEQEQKLKDSLERTFGSIETLRTTMLDTAAAMFGPGFVWLVWAKDSSLTAGASGRKGDWRILTTYLAGTPYPEAGYRQQGLDMNTSNASTFEAYRVANSAGKFGSHSKSAQEDAHYPPGGTRVSPVLCVNTWEHVYIYDFGLPGKRKFLADWWDAIDWKVVADNTPQEARVEAGYRI